MNNDDDDDRRDRKEWHDDTNLCTAFADKSCVARCILVFYFMAEKIEMAHVLVDNALSFFLLPCCLDSNFIFFSLFSHCQTDNAKWI